MTDPVLTLLRDSADGLFDMDGRADRRRNLARLTVVDRGTERKVRGQGA